jgi:hypothetical protein
VLLLHPPWLPHRWFTPVFCQAHETTISSIV